MKESAKMISIIIPAYNQAAYVGETIQCVLQQTFRDFELIVVDDGSTDQTPEVVRTFTDLRVRYIRQDNGGLSAARNAGIDASSAPYLIFLDADDLLLPDALANHLDNIRTEADFGLSVGGWQYINSEGEPISDLIFPPSELSAPMLLEGNPFPVHSVLLNRKWLDRIQWFDESLRACEDWDLWLRVLSLGVSVVPFNQVVCQYRMHEGQMTRQPDRMRTAMLAVLDKTFGDSGLPTKWQDQKNKAYAAAYIRAAARAYHANTLVDARNDLDEAVRLDPALLQDQASRLEQQLAGWANAPMTKNPLDYLERVYENLPESLADLREYRRRNLGKMAMQQAFESYYRGNLSAARTFLLRAFRYQPGFLRNRGALSIFIRSYL